MNKEYIISLYHENHYKNFLTIDKNAMELPNKNDLKDNMLENMRKNVNHELTKNENLKYELK